MHAHGSLSRIVRPFILGKRESFDLDRQKDRDALRDLSEQEMHMIGGAETVPFLPSSTYCYLTSCNLLHLEFCRGDDRAVDAE